MPVASILAYLASGMSVDQILREWPELEREDTYEALEYAAWVMPEGDQGLPAPKPRPPKLDSHRRRT